MNLLKNDHDGLNIIPSFMRPFIWTCSKTIISRCTNGNWSSYDDGFYFDILLDESLSDRSCYIEDKMRELAKTDYKIIKEIVSRDKAKTVFKDRDENYKLKLIDDIPEDEVIALYHHNEYIDMCRGPHLINTKFLKYFKLMKISGSYWRGNSNNQTLQRIYGTAWEKKSSLDNYLLKLEEAEKRDHRKLGQKLDFFHFQEEAPGMVFWHANGFHIFNQVKNYITAYLIENDYKIIDTPQILDKSLWKKSGHLDKFSDLIFDAGSENKEFAIKPMSCPGHIQVYNHGLKSYRDLPLKYAEFGKVHRNEPSGTLHGLLRLRAFTQDDAHIFCTIHQVEDEIGKLIDNINDIYNIFGFRDIFVELSTRPEKRVGDDRIWDISESALKKTLESKNVKWKINEGDGAFYGPKIDFSLKDSIGRVWQLGTIQLDFSMPERLSATYVNEEGNKVAPVMIHRAILGSLERFVGILIEEYSGNFPLWLSPQQIQIINITSAQDDYCIELRDKLRSLNFRVDTDLRNEKINLKIRENAILRIPYLLVVGDNELKNNTVSIRTRDGDNLGEMGVEKFIKMLETLVDTKSRKLTT
ncbi:MAG: threonine--tRNA ligase [Gammaproteobacteria bacterium]|nr:MAG: threonine--tRNA ligase [Gammaproteobacteria bacterium]